jgi:hypothetical protein
MDKTYLSTHADFVQMAVSSQCICVVPFDRVQHFDSNFRGFDQIIDWFIERFKP